MIFLLIPFVLRIASRIALFFTEPFIIAFIPSQHHLLLLESLSQLGTHSVDTFLSSYFTPYRNVNITLLILQEIHHLVPHVFEEKLIGIQLIKGSRNPPLLFSSFFLIYGDLLHMYPMMVFNTILALLIIIHIILVYSPFN